MVYSSRIKGQVSLETAIVFVSLALLSLGSVALFSNLNRNLVDRFDLYRDTRKAAVNTIAPIGAQPLDFLDYSPNQNIIPGDKGSEGYFWEKVFDDPRLEEAADLWEDADRLLNEVLPLTLSTVYMEKLSGNWWDGSGRDYRNAIQARNLCDKMLVDLDGGEALLILDGDPYKENPPGAYPKFVRGRNLIQKVIDDPDSPWNQPEPEDPDSFEHKQWMRFQETKEQLLALLDRLDRILWGEDKRPGTSDDTGSIYWLIYFRGDDTYIGSWYRVYHARWLINYAIEYWNYTGYWAWYREYFRREAHRHLQPLYEFYGESEGVRSSLISLLNDAYRKLNNPNYDNVIGSRKICNEIISSGYLGDGGLIKEARDDLNSALNLWYYPERRDSYISQAREKIRRVKENIRR